MTQTVSIPKGMLDRLLTHMARSLSDSYLQGARRGHSDFSPGDEAGTVVKQLWALGRKTEVCAFVADFMSALRVESPLRDPADLVTLGQFLDGLARSFPYSVTEGQREEIFAAIRSEVPDRV